MHFTKQDILTLAKLLGKLGVKDSSFVNLDEVEDSTYIPVVSDKMNMKVSAKKLAKYMQSNIPVEISGLKSTNLKEALYELITYINQIKNNGGGGGGGNNNTIFATDVSCYFKINDDTPPYENVDATLTYLVAETINTNKKLSFAEEQDITNIFKPQ